MRIVSESFVLRMPPGLRQRVKAAAEGDRRSMNAEILCFIDEALEARRAAGAQDEAPK